MKNFLLNKKFIASLGTISIISAFGLSALNYNLATGQSSLHKVNSGVSVCFERVGQSFTALMIQDLSSSYLQKDFQAMTGECFNEVARSLAEVSESSSLVKNVNNLKSDLFWFDQKVNKIVGMAEGRELDLSQSNISNKYYELYEMKSKLESSIEGEASKFGESISWSLIGIFMGLGGFLLSLLALNVKNRLKGKELQEATDQFMNSNILEYNQWQLSLKNLLDKIVDPELSELLCNTYIKKDEEILSLQAKLNRAAIMSDRYELNIESSKGDLAIYDEKTDANNPVDFNFLMNTVIEKLNDKIQTKSLMLDMDLNDEFHVTGVEEDLQQFMYSLLNYNISTFTDTVGKALRIKSKALGGIAYCQISREGMPFNNSEIKILSGSGSTPIEAPVQLTILRELLDETGLNISIKNKMTSTDQVDGVIEVIFNRYEDLVTDNAIEERVQKSTTNIVKGNKAAIREFFDRQLEVNQ